MLERMKRISRLSGRFRKKELNFQDLHDLIQSCFKILWLVTESAQRLNIHKKYKMENRIEYRASPTSTLFFISLFL